MKPHREVDVKSLATLGSLILLSLPVVGLAQVTNYTLNAEDVRRIENSCPEGNVDVGLSRENHVDAVRSICDPRRQRAWSPRVTEADRRLFGDVLSQTERACQENREANARGDYEYLSRYANRNRLSQDDRISLRMMCSNVYQE